MNVTLKRLYEKEISDLKEINWVNKKEVSRFETDSLKRKKKVKQLLSDSKLKVAADFHHAALILQHGDNSTEYKLANNLAKKAMELGDTRSKWLYAATLDRLLLSTGKPQKFGTQFVQNSKGEWKIAKPIDKTVTDEERAKYNVPPLSQALRVYKQKYKMPIIT